MKKLVSIVEHNNSIHDPVYIDAGLVDIDKTEKVKYVMEKSMINILRMKSGLKHFTACVEFTTDGIKKFKYIKV